jgi:hypothetical protein
MPWLVVPVHVQLGSVVAVQLYYPHHQKKELLPSFDEAI